MGPTLQAAIVTFIFIAVAAFDLALAVGAYRKSSSLGDTLMGCLICAAVISVFYLSSILTRDYFTASLTSSIYFCFIDFMLLFLLRFIYVLIGIDFKNAKHMRQLHWVLRIAVALDSASLMLNPYTMHAIGYDFYPGSAIAPYVFKPLWPYELHLFLCYIMILYGFVLMAEKAMRVPKLYRALYVRVIACVLGVVVLNAFYLAGKTNYNVDISIITYSILGGAIYAAVLMTGNKRVLDNAREIILQNSNQPLLIFDYKGYLFYANTAARTLFNLDEHDINQANQSEQSFDKGILHVSEFVRMLDIDNLAIPYSKHERFYWTSPEKDHTSYICDFQTIKDERNADTAMSFVFTNNMLGVDPLTGFQTEQYFILHSDELSQPAKTGLVGVAICDLNQLSLLNNVLSYDSGDQAIVLQAKLLRKYMPPRSIFIRLRDAKLGVICYDLSYDEIKERLAMISEELSQDTSFNMKLKMDYAICMLDKTDGEVSNASAQAVSILKTRKLLDRESNHSATIEALSNMLMECDPETEAHVRRTRILGDSLAYNMGLSDYERDQLSLLCLFHDIGKVGIPLQILNKPAALTDEEWAIMREHVQKGYRIAHGTPGLEVIADPILHHHENWDGSGYPDGLEHESIPILSRIISVIDAYDAMVSDRPYRAGMPPAKAIEELKRCAGTQFDPFVVEVFVGMIDQTQSSEEIVENSLKDIQSHYTGVGAQEKVLPSKTALVVPVAYSQYTLDANYKIVEADENFEALTGYTAYDIEHLNLGEKELIFDEDQEVYWELQRELSGKGPIAYLEHRIKRKDGTGRYVYCLGVKHHVNGGMGMQVVLTDITESSTAQQKADIVRNRAMMSLRRLEETVRLDPMTQLLNKSAFRKTCENELVMHEGIFVLMMFDIDYFKAFNDTLGHPKGDGLLVAFAKKLAKEVEGVGYAGRVGGDEFACFIKFDSETPLVEIAQRCRTIRKDLNDTVQRYALGLVQPWPSVSAGAVYASPTLSDYAELYAMADEALYEAKRGGRDRICISWERSGEDD